MYSDGSVTYIGNLTTNLANYNRIIGENEG